MEGRRDQVAETQSGEIRETAPLALALARYNRVRIILRDGLGDHQPFLLLASLSFVIASFLQGSSAAGLAALASVYFLGAVAFSIAQDFERIPNLVLILLFYSSAASGFILLLFVGFVIIVAVPGAAIGLVLAGSLGVFMLAVVFFFEALRRFRLRMA